MALSLSSADQKRFEMAVEALLSPLDSPDPEQACRSALRPIMDLFGVDRAAFRIPEGKRLRMLARGFDSDVIDKLTRVHAGVAGGRNLYTGPALDLCMARLYERNCMVWDFPLLERVTKVPLVDQELYHEVGRPAGMQHHCAAAVSLPQGQGQAMLGMAYDDPGADRFGPDRLTVLRLLRPALEAGMHALWHGEGRRRTLEHALDCASDGFMICDPDGRELHRNGALRRFLAEDPEPDTLLAAMKRAARRVANLRRAAAKTEPFQVPPPGTREVATPFSRYTVRASYLPPRTFAPNWSVLVALDRARPELPTARVLQRRFELTPKEAEVALLLARGLSNAEIADRLVRSPHTIRHHVEHIFRKMGIHSRKALALRLLAGRD